MDLKRAWDNLAENGRRFGWPGALAMLAHRLVNKVIFFDWLEVIVLERDGLRPLDPEAARRATSRLASREELVAMTAEPAWGVGVDKIRNYDQGDRCVLSLLGEEIAGYTWVHDGGRPEIVPGLHLRVPPRYLYNYAGFTAHKFRGAGLQSLRHHSVLGQPQWSDRAALLGYVRRTNYASRKGQGRSGYRTVGSIILVGTPARFRTWFSPALRALGVRRLRSDELAPAPAPEPGRPATDPQTVH